MSYYPVRRTTARSLLISQGVVLLFILVNLFVPPEYQGVVVTLYFVAFMAIFMLTSLRQRAKGADVRDIASGRKILVIKQEEVTELQSKDLELVSELKPLLKVSGISMLSLVLALLWFFIIYPSLVQRLLPPDGGVAERVVKLLVLYEVPITLSYTIQSASRRLVKRYVNVLRSVEVYSTGVLGTPGFALRFPVQGYGVRACPRRGFVEFVKNEGGVEILYRVYTNSVERLADVVARYGKTRVDRVA